MKATLVLLLSLMAANPAPKGYVCGRASGPIAVDGRIDDEAWKHAPWTDDFVDIEGDLKPRPRLRTRARMLWDDRYFYVAAELTEPHVWGTLIEHDSVIFRDNDFEVFIDPDGDNHEYYELEINALNTEWDLLLEKPYRDGGPALNSWEVPGLKTAVHVDGKINDPLGEDRSWTVELAIPWKALADRAHRPAPPLEGDAWRVNFSRVEWDHTIEGPVYKKIPDRPEHNWVWSPQGAVDMHRPERWGYVQFTAGPPEQVPFRPDPTLDARDRLIEIYRAQADYRKKNGAWAESLARLDLPERPASAPGQSPPTLRTFDGGYEVSITLDAAPARAAKTITIRQDSRLTLTP